MIRTKDIFDKVLFWDVDIDQVNLDKHDKYIIGRVMMKGDWKDFQSIRKYYGDEHIKKTIVQIRFLDKLTLNFLSTYFQIPKEEFRCYNMDQSIKELWDF